MFFFPLSQQSQFRILEFQLRLVFPATHRNVITFFRCGLEHSCLYKHNFIEVDDYPTAGIFRSAVGFLTVTRNQFLEGLEIRLTSKIGAEQKNSYQINSNEDNLYIKL